MRKLPEPARRFDIRRLVQEEEARIEVSDLEKILSQLAYLMNLYIEQNEEVRPRLREAIGASPRLFSELSPEQIKHLDGMTPDLKLPRKPRLLFWMWRAWLLQKDFEGLDAHYVSGRSAMEWHDLDEGTQQARRELSCRLEALASEIRSLCDTAWEARYALDAFGGSPLAVIHAARKLLLGAVDRTCELERRVSLAYGFGESHRPNKRYDKKSLRNLRAYFNWNHQREAAGTTKEFETKEDGTRLTTAQARKAVSQAASRVGILLDDYHAALEKSEKAGTMPTAFYARRLDRVLQERS